MDSCFVLFGTRQHCVRHGGNGRKVLISPTSVIQPLKHLKNTPSRSENIIIICTSGLHYIHVCKCIYKCLIYSSSFQLLSLHITYRKHAVFNREQAKATKCLKNLVTSNCTFPPEAQEAWDLGFSDYNPYCASNRDTGVTGNDTCFGVKDLENPSTKLLKNSISTNTTNTDNINSTTPNYPSNNTFDIPSNNAVENNSSNNPPNKENAAAVTKSSALQALFSFVSLLFVFKI